MNKKITASDYCLRVTDGTHDTPKPVEEGYYLVTSKHISNGSLNFSDAYKISEKDYCEINKRSQVEQWDILFSMIGSVGEIYLERNPNPQYAIKNLGLFKMGGDKHKAIKLYYFLRSSFFQKKLNFRLSGSVQSFVPLQFLRELELPDMSHISNETVDEIELLQEKIDLNTQLISHLKEYSELIFHKWFVDFNFPNDDDSPYKDSGGEMKESESKMIPVGWDIDVITKVGDIVAGGTPPTENEAYFSVSGIPWITPKDLSTNKNIYISRGAIDISEEGYSNSSAKLMPKGTVLMSSRAPIGYLGIAKNSLTTNQGFKSIVPKPGISSEFIYYTLQSQMSKIKRIASGSTFKEVSKEILSRLKVIIPEPSILLKFDNIIIPISNKIRYLEEENELLMETRDLLIRKLINL